MSDPTQRRGDDWWRHLILWVAIALAVFPPLYVITAAFNADQTLSGTSLLPRSFTLENFKGLFVQKEGGAEVFFVRWFRASVIIAVLNAFFTVFIGALSAYAFSRFRFRGRRMGMLFLLLIQMFPGLLNLVAIYLIVLRTGEVVPALGLNKLTALLLVYLSGAMSINLWLMKGFFDSIPSELDESARVDGATPAQIFWGVILPLAVPVLSVVGMFAFVGTLNEFMTASVLLETVDNFTLPLGLQAYISTNFEENWGSFAAGVLIAQIPAIIGFIFVQKYIIAGLTQGSVKG
ncbi:MAG: sugar ABC transporter permease [Ilumatobacteraceae bacterium]|jgi:arabinogalactan oligomer/maltooligosaccharide transport system permease protein|nr:sugar ABC transporter permease [Actinomycetota bacterium]NCW90997.1 sugar ABC transporter permease [Acidimicrobiia bacterium]NBS36686.1 sugar ABC transporter permease [Actinomycetota bacterium]NCX79267.1 sugar ABC transporter permease [Actinomycetota bacterium]NCZ55469.1 sugar ABC transporter permease [Acidimicrobiia bacterium]